MPEQQSLEEKIAGDLRTTMDALRKEIRAGWPIQSGQDLENTVVMHNMRLVSGGGLDAVRTLAELFFGYSQHIAAGKLPGARYILVKNAPENSDYFGFGAHWLDESPDPKAKLRIVCVPDKHAPWLYGRVRSGMQGVGDIYADLDEARAALQFWDVEDF